MFFLLPFLSGVGSALGSAGSAIGSGIGSAASTVGSSLLSAGKGLTGPLLTKGQAAGPASVGMTGGMSDLPAVAGESGVMGAIRGLANSVVPGSEKLLTKGNFMSNFNSMLKDPRFLNYMTQSKLFPEQEEQENQPRKYS